MKISVYYLLMLILVGLVIPAMGQESNNGNNDFGIWYRITSTKKINKQNKIQLSISQRYNRNGINLKNRFVEIGLDQKIKKQIGCGFRFRLTQDPIKGRVRVRYSLFSKVTHSIKPISLSYRFKYDFSNSRGYFDHRLRNKIKLQYNRKSYKVAPFLTLEIFNVINSFQNKLNRFRIKFGFEYEMTKNIFTDLAYIYQQELFERNPLTENLISVRLKYKL